MKLYTCGYEGIGVEEFVTHLADAGVRVVIDVRERPISRKKGFSKRALAGHLAEAGLGYLHVPELGCPKSIRDRYKADRKWSAYTRSFCAYLKQQQAALQRVAAISRAKTACLICFEADYQACHRSFVARAACGAGAPAVFHLIGGRVVPDLDQAAA